MRRGASTILAASVLTFTTTAVAGTGTETSSRAPRLHAGDLPRRAVTFRQQPVFFIADDGTARAKERARRLSGALEAAIESPSRAELDAPDAEVHLADRATAFLSVRGHPVGELFDSDARAAGHADLESYATSLEEGLQLFVADQRRRAALQGTALRVVFAAMILVIGLLALRLARYLFGRADDYLDDKSGSIRPLSLLGVPIVSAELLSAAAALTFGIGRIASYIGIIASTVLLSLSQFGTTRPWAEATVSWASRPVLSGLKQLLLALPRLGLAAILLVIASAGLRAARVLFDDEGPIRTSFGTLTPPRARVLRIVASIGVVLLMAPLVIAAAFGQFHTPLEVLLIATAASGAFALVPLFASGVVGLVTLWRGKLAVGETVRVRGIRGEVVSITPWDVEVQNADGVRTTLPMLSLLAAEVSHREIPRSASLRATAKRLPEVRDTLETVRRAVHEVAPGAAVSCLGFDASEVEVRVTPASPEIDMERILLCLSDIEEGDLRILGARIEPPA